MTLLDYPEHVACTVFLGGCDFRCPFCHNFELVEWSGNHGMSDEEFFDFLKKRRGLLDGVAITGGEPCLRKDLPDFIANIRDKGFLVKLDTNGNHPRMLELLIKQKLVNYIAMDIKNSPEKYAETAGLIALDTDSIMESISLIINSNLPYEFRTTVINEYHDDNSFHGIGHMIEGAKKYFLQSFVDRDTVPNHNLSSPSVDDLNRYRDIVSDYVEEALIRGTD